MNIRKSINQMIDKILIDLIKRDIGQIMKSLFMVYDIMIVYTFIYLFKTNKKKFDEYSFFLDNQTIL